MVFVDIEFQFNGANLSQNIVVKNGNTEMSGHRVAEAARMSIFARARDYGHDLGSYSSIMTLTHLIPFNGYQSDLLNVGSVTTHASKKSVE